EMGRGTSAGGKGQAVGVAEIHGSDGRNPRVPTFIPPGRRRKCSCDGDLTLVGQREPSVREQREIRIVRHLPEMAVGIREVAGIAAPEYRLLRPGDASARGVSPPQA